MKALVLKSTGSDYLVKANDGLRYRCKVKGLFRLKGADTTNPVSVGDWIEFTSSAGSDFGMITKIYDRQNYIIRKSIKLSKQFHIIAANIDFAFVIATPLLPKTSTGFIDRYLATAEAYAIPAGIIFNKSDLYDDKIKKYTAALKNLYEEIGYACFVVSALKENSHSELKIFLKNKVSLFSGHSGVGKSTLINELIPDLNLKTSQISQQHLKGTHTTTFAEMHELPDGGFIIDTPGIREFGVIEFKPSEVSHYFPELFRLSKGCKFYDCMHVNENNCAVLEGLKAGKISESRYSSYLSILNNEDIFR